MSDYFLTHTSKEFKIYKNKNIDNIFKIILNEPNEALLLSIKMSKLLTGITINTLFTTIIFQADSVKIFSEYKTDLKKKQGSPLLSYEKALDLVYSLTNQLIKLKNINHSFYCYNPENIIVIDDTYFFHISKEYLMEIDEAEDNPSNTNKTYFLTFIAPFNITPNLFIAPELKKINVIPTSVDYKAIYYSLGSFVIYSLFEININICLNKEEINKIESINGTKLYWFLCRSILEEPLNRSLLYI
jgi:hypothetical protein